MKKLSILLCAGMFSYFLHSQVNEPSIEYIDGYALRGNDTIWCKIKVMNKHIYTTMSVTLLTEDKEISFPAGGLIRGFGLEYDGKKFDLGTVIVERKLGSNSSEVPQYVPKIVTGAVELYEYKYRIIITKRTSVNDLPKPGSTISSQEDFVNFYIARTDTSSPALTAPVLLNSFRKKDIEPYIADNFELITGLEKKKLSKTELITVLKEYNRWAKEKKNQ